MIELLAPAQNKECAIAAINYGADAVYIGASSFGARKNAPNSLEDIKQVVDYAHKFWAKVYVTINTILKDGELDSAQKLIYQLYEIGVDALIVQDMGLLELDLPPIPLHASTQCNNVTLEKVKFLQDIGFKRAILARELSLSEIENIKRNTDIELEVFIHGALCVSYSGQCYMSFANGGRSANRGECAQPCRKKYSLFDQTNNAWLAKDKHLLSLKDFNASRQIERLIEIGVTSFKIEGRLKDADYVKNVVAFYRKLIDKYAQKSSSGTCFFDFEPNASKSFNRGFCDYFLEGRKECYNFLTPKSIGEKVGTVEKIFKNGFVLKGEKIHSQDGLCFFDNEKLEGFLVNKVEGDKIFPQKNVLLKKGTTIYRNFDCEFQKKLETSKTKRKISAKFIVDKTNLKVVDEDDNCIEIAITAKENANNYNKMKMVYEEQLKKSGESDFYIENVEFEQGNELKFLKISEINNLRRKALELLMQERLKNYKRTFQDKITYTQAPWNNLDFRANVFNKKAENFYKKCGCSVDECAMEKDLKTKGRPLMTTKHCLKYAFSLCGKKDKLSLFDEKGKEYELKFNCKNCQMEIYESDK